jgi:iron complex outermembrane receptor protein
MIKSAFRCALLAGSAIGLATPALAQEQPPENKVSQSQSAEASTIVVTARRVEERLQDVPISISVFNQEQLAQRNILNAQDLAANTPSLSANGNFGAENTTFAIRGFAQDIGTLPSVGVYFADVVTPRGGSNGQPSGDGLLPGQMFDLQNVQVLKGPQGTLFGRNTTGGAVLLVPQKPTHDNEGYVQMELGNYNMVRLQAVLNLAVSDTFRVRLGVDHQTRDGYIHNVSGIGPDRFSDVDYWGARLGVVGDLTPDLENYLLFTYNRSKTNGPVNKLVAADAGDPATNRAAPLFGILATDQLARQGTGFYNVMQTVIDPHQVIDQWQAINTTTWRSSDTLTIKNIISYSQYKQDTVAPLFGTDFVAPDPALAAYHFPFAMTAAPPGLDTANQSTFTEELQFQGNAMDNRLSWTSGAYLEVSNPLRNVGSRSQFLASCTDNAVNFQCTDPMGQFINDGLVQQGLIPAGLDIIHLGTINTTIGKTAFHDVGLYAQATYKFTDHLKLTGGFRYTWDKQTNTSFRTNTFLNYPVDGPGQLPTPFINVDPASGSFNIVTVNPRCTDPTAVNCTKTLEQKSNAPTWLIDFDYTPTDDILLYAKYARGYRAGTIAPNISAPFNLVKPEKVDTFEAGLKTSFAGAVRGTFNLAGFYNDFSNQQLQVGFNARPGSGQSSTAAPVNVNKSEIWGFEADATITPFRGLDLSAGYTYLRTKIKEIPDFSTFNDPNFTFAAAFHVGDPEVLSPENKFSVSGTYTLPLDESIGRIAFNANYTWRDKMLVNYTDRANLDASVAAFSYLPSLGLLNLNLDWYSVGGSGVDLGAFVSNATNEHYYTFAAGLGDPQVGFETANLGEPRMYGARLKVHFGPK